MRKLALAVVLLLFMAAGPSLRGAYQWHLHAMSHEAQKLLGLAGAASRYAPDQAASTYALIAGDHRNADTLFYLGLGFGALGVLCGVILAATHRPRSPRERVSNLAQAAEVTPLPWRPRGLLNEVWKCERLRPTDRGYTLHTACQIPRD